LSLLLGCCRHTTAEHSEFGKFTAEETEKWAKVRFAGIKPD
jgi:hypothetical protein